jgi:2-hydroxy-6-oxonona-2,4-dienedioate hydrolase
MFFLYICTTMSGVQNLIIFAIGVISISGCFPNKQIQNLHPKPFENSTYITINGVHLHYREWNKQSISNKPKILLIHGFSGSTYSWRYIADSLSQKGYNVIAIDIPPFGYSDRSIKINSSFSGRSHLLFEFIHTIKPNSQWHIIGHSMGGGIAQALGILHPNSIVSVSFLGGALFTQTGTARNSTPLIFRLPLFVHFITSIAENLLITEKQIERLLHSAYGSIPDKTTVSMYTKPLSIKGTAKSIFISMTRWIETDSITASQLTIPALCIWGKNDTWVPIERSQNAINQFKNSQTHIIENSAHCPMETHPAQCLELLISFFKEIEDER